MEIKKGHKVAFGSFATIVIIFMITTGVMFYVTLKTQQDNFNTLDQRIESYQTDTQSKLSELTDSIIETQNELRTVEGEIETRISDLDDEFDVLKSQTSADFSGIIDTAIMSVVTVRTDVGQGSGFIIDEEGYLVTNHHVVEGADSATVYTYEGNPHTVTLIGNDPQMDISLLKIDGNFEELNLGNSNDLEIGEKVIAIGNPLGLQFSVSEGIVSAVHREGINGIEAYIQTDAALNPGNSGGPLINTEGEAVGINNFKIGSGENLGFALESNYIEDTVNEIYLDSFNETLI